MKLILKICTTFLLIQIIVSCTNEKKSELTKIEFPRTINLNLSEATTDSMNLSEIAEKVEYIPLQTSDKDLMGYFYDFAITNNYFFIQNELSVLIFDKNGHFVNSLFTLGRGPGEAKARCFAVDEKRELVYVFDIITKKVKIYDFNGKYINTIKKPINPPEYWTWKIGFFNNNLFVATPQNPKNKHLYSCYDLQIDSIRVIYKNFRKYDKSQEDKRPITLYDYSYQITDSTIMFKEWFSDSILKMDKSFKIEPRYIINLGNQKLEWEDWRDHGMFNIAGGPPIGFWVQTFTETKSFLLITLNSFKKPTLFAVFNKSTGVVRIFMNRNYNPKTNVQVYLKNDLDKIIAYPPMNKNEYLFYYGNCLYTVIEAKDFAKAYQASSSETKNSTEYLRKMAPVLNAITDFSNPIIMKVYLK